MVSKMVVLVVSFIYGFLSSWALKNKTNTASHYLYFVVLFGSSCIAHIGIVRHGIFGHCSRIEPVLINDSDVITHHRLEINHYK